MKAIELYDLNGIDGLRMVEIQSPKPKPSEVLIEVKAAGLNYYELELIRGRYPLPKPLPLTMGAEAAGIVVESGCDKTIEEGRLFTNLVERMNGAIRKSYCLARQEIEVEQDMFKLNIWR